MARRGIPLEFRLLEPDGRLRDQPDADLRIRPLSTYGQAFWVGLLNTLLVGAIGIVFATLIGFVVAASRACRRTGSSPSSPPSTSRLLRNIPLLLQLLFWYNAS